MTGGVILESGTLDPTTNFELWRQEIGSIFDVTALDKDFRETFRADLSRYNLGFGLVGRVAVSALQYARSERLVGEVGVDHLLIQLYERGETVIDADGRMARVEAGDVVVLDLSRPLRSHASRMSAANLVLPRMLLGLSPTALDQAHGVVPSGATPLGGLAGDHLRALLRAAPGLTEEAAGRIVTASSAIFHTCLAPSLAAADEGAVLSVTLQRIRRYIDRSLHDPGLDAAGIGARFGLSRSALYRLFEPVGGVSAYVKNRRLERARLTIAIAAERGGVARLALQLGFPSEAAFSRAFRARYEASPRDAARLRLAEKASDAVMGSTSLDAWLKSLSA